MNIKHDFSFEGFKDFVDARDPEEVINHRSWRTCAVGLYVKDTFTINEEEVADIAGDVADMHLNVLMPDSLGWWDGNYECNDEWTLGDFLNCSGDFCSLNADKMCEESSVDTYGELQTVLAAIEAEQ